MKYPRRSRLPFITAVVVLVACENPNSPQTTPAAPPPPAFDVVAGSSESEPVPGRYIVVFRDDVEDAPGLARRLAAQHGASPLFTYSTALKGFAVDLPEQAASALARNPNVAYVEQDQVMRAVDTQSGATWGIDRIDQRALPLSGRTTTRAPARG